MISLTPLIKHLEPKPAGFAGLWFRKVGGAAEFAQIRVENLPLPAAWIVRAADKVSHAGERAEDVTLAFDVVIAIENVRSHTQGDTDDALLLYRKAVKTLLLGWQCNDPLAALPPEGVLSPLGAAQRGANTPGVHPIKFTGGQVLEYTAGDLFWRDRYQFAALITNYLPDPPAYGDLKFTGEQPL